MSNPYESSATPAVVPSSTTVQIRSLGVLSCAKMMGALYGVLGLIVGAFMTLFSMVGAAFSDNGNGAAALGLGAASIIVIPIMYAIMGFVGGIIMGFFYNVIAGVVGGIEIRTTLIDQI
jgi:hypothetical protein